MRSIIVAITIVLGIAATPAAQTAAPATPAAAPAAAQDAKFAKGMAVYAAQRCSLCHSIAGKGNKNGSLDGVGSKLSAAEMHTWIVDAEGMTAKTKSTRKPLMKSYKLPAADLEALVDYMMSLKK
jgi:mono/diheme cytochrome c family protein